jgi:PAS domain S-box-containing protein
MSETDIFIGIRQQLSRRMLPLVTIMGLLITLIAPVTYFVIEHQNLKRVATLYARDLAEKMRDLARETPGLWKYQSYKFMEIVNTFHPGLEVEDIAILDEKSTPIPGYVYREYSSKQWLPLTIREDFVDTLVTAPIQFNNRQVGTIALRVSDRYLHRNSLIIGIVSSCVGIILAVIAFRYPVGIVGKLETSLEELISRVQQSERNYRSLVNNIPDVIWSADQRGNTVFISPNLQRIFGYTPEEVNRDPSLWHGSIHPDDLERVKDAFVSLFILGGSFDVEYRLRRKDGEWIWLHDRAIGTYEREGVIYADGIVTDVTVRKQAEEKLALQGQELIRSNAELEQFAYVASHDLQEPLRMVTSYMQLISRRYKGKLDADADEFINFAVDGAMRMHRLINDLLLYSRVGTKRKALEPTDCNIILKCALDNLQEAISESNARIEAAHLPIIYGDSVQLIQLFQNMLGNACKFRSNEPPVITIRAEPQGIWWTFSVHDNGIGIEEKHFDRIFQIFQRLHDRDSYPGTGIGLSVCKKIVERHGGKIWLESKPREGTTFYFTLPAIQEKTAWELDAYN